MAVGNLHQPIYEFLIIVEALPFSRARLSVVADFDGADTFSIRGSNRSCRVARRANPRFRECRAHVTNFDITFPRG